MTFSEQVQYRGTPFEYGDHVLIVPPLPLGLAREFSKEFWIAGGDITDDASIDEKFKVGDGRFEVQVKAISAALKRNYPDIADTDIQDFVTLENVFAIYSSAITGSKPTETAKTVGEAKAVMERSHNPTL